MNGWYVGARLAHVGAIAAAVLVGGQSAAQPLELSVVNEGNNWAAGCGTDEYGVDFCAVQKSDGPQALGYVLQQREDGVERQIRISVATIFIDAESPVTIQVDDNEPLVWTVGYKVIDGHVISLDGQSIDPLLQELETGQTVVVTVHQTTGEPAAFELTLEGFTDAIEALEQASAEATE